MRNAGLKEAQAGIKIVGRNTNNLRYADDTTLMAESEEDRRVWDHIFKLLEEKNCQPRILYSAKLSITNKGEIRTFPDKQKLRKFITNRSAF